MEDKNRESDQSMRAELSILTNVAQKGETQKILKKKQRIKKEIKKKQQTKELQTVRESLKMKIQAKARRIKRHVKRSKQFSQNQMVASNRKKVFRDLGKEQIPIEKTT